MVKANSDLYDPTNPLALVIATIENDSDERFGAPDVKTMTTRIDRGDACRVDAIATVAGVSRATLLGQLILIGLDQVTTNLSSASVRKYSQQLAKEFEKEFPGAWQKVEALGEDDESVSKREIQIYETIKNQQLVDKFLTDGE